MGATATDRAGGVRVREDRGACPRRASTEVPHIQSRGRQSEGYRYRAWGGSVEGEGGAWL